MSRDHRLLLLIAALSGVLVLVGYIHHDIEVTVRAAIDLQGAL